LDATHSVSTSSKTKTKTNRRREKERMNEWMIVVITLFMRVSLTKYQTIVPFIMNGCEWRQAAMSKLQRQTNCGCEKQEGGKTKRSTLSLKAPETNKLSLWTTFALRRMPELLFRIWDGELFVEKHSCFPKDSRRARCYCL
jgi:hypothetical protein